ncbi:MAG: hypothetical protein WCS37_01035 [Chloroflexota bacterium]|nr:hypothetical protein [Chloroflexota bacterium]
MAMTLNLRADRELWKYIFVHYPFSSSLHLSVLPDYNHVWAEQLYREDPELHPELLTPRHQRIIKAVARQGRVMGVQIKQPSAVKECELAVSR